VGNCDGIAARDPLRGAGQILGGCAPFDYFAHIQFVVTGLPSFSVLLLFCIGLRHISRMQNSVVRTFLVCAIVFACGLKVDRDSRGGIGLNSEDPLVWVQNINVDHFEGELASVRNRVVQPVTISNVRQDISVQLPIFDFSHLIKREAAINPSQLVLGNQLWNVGLGLPGKENPRLLQPFCGGQATKEHLKPLCSSISSIDYGQAESDIFDARLWVNGVINARRIKEYKSSLTDNIVASDEIGLPNLYTRISEYGEKCKESNPVFWLFPVTLFFAGSLGLIHALPRRNLLGVCEIFVSSVSWVTATILVMSHLFPMYGSDNASASFGSYCVSAQTYSRTEDVRIVPIVIPEFEFRNIDRQIFSADLMLGSDDAALQIDQKPSIVLVWTTPTTCIVANPRSASPWAAAVSSLPRKRSSRNERRDPAAGLWGV
jgi:hypothetical protein